MLAFFRTLLAVVVGIFLTIFIFIFFLIFIGIASQRKVEVSNNTVLKLNLNHRIPERPRDNPFANFNLFGGGFDRPLSLMEILGDIQHAKSDKHIRGIYMELDLVQADYSTLEEIRNALIDFRKSGKFVYSYGEFLEQKSYYIASVSDSIFLNPNGAFRFTGFHSEQFFIKGLLDKLEIEPKLIRAGKYKSAGEMFINSSMSDPNREQLTAYVNSAYGTYLQKIGASRNMDVAELRHIADSLLIKFPKDAVTYRLVDRLVYKDQVISSIKNRLGVESEDDIEAMEMDEYNKTVPRGRYIGKSLGGDNIALIYAVGDIVGGDGDEERIGSDKLSETIRRAREDDDVKAIVLRINSPGGSALASDVIWREVKLAKRIKPVIASFGNLAASGGYYIAAPADYIFCEPNTITGSIGVFGLIPNLEMFWKDKLGITFDRVKTGPYADMPNLNRKMTKEEEAIIQMLIDTTYEQFKNRVAEGRKLSHSFVDSIAQGRIYSGEQAKQIGLIDQIGSLNDAIRMAAGRAGLKKYSIRVLPHYEPNLRKLLGNMTSEEMLMERLGDNYTLFKNLEKASQLQGILMYFPYQVELN